MDIAVPPVRLAHVQYFRDAHLNFYRLRQRRPWTDADLYRRFKLNVA